MLLIYTFLGTCILKIIWALYFTMVLGEGDCGVWTVDRAVGSVDIFRKKNLQNVVLVWLTKKTGRRLPGFLTWVMIIKQ